ncbi:ubiquinol oxidase subunit II [Acidithiobacillus sp. AMEEHan]|uniref:ubiquinol oxidase subunit II n=1 Tax=Acidithiobacillus sp. AMEEHan TaxID=2994951 RepID=UPI0027E41FA7|nr:ubiquinol oxidase subunit II [Acidithiobacillus sp. AMEEHan]
MDPQGLIAKTSYHYFLLDVGIMLLIVVPTAALAIWAMIRYRKGGKGTYQPKWAHSWTIEAIVWGIPLITVGVLSYLSVKAIYAVNPYNPGAISQAQKKAGGDPLEVDVIATDWRWLFIYPKQHIATTNELVVPKGIPVRFRLTSTSVVNDFIIPQLVGMIDVMPGMRTKQALVSDHIGSYVGFSADYSGAGLSWMHFTTKVVSKHQFSSWVSTIQTDPQKLTLNGFNRFARPYIPVGEKSQPKFGEVQQGLFDLVVNEVMKGKTWKTPMDMTENMVAYLNNQNELQKEGYY